MILLDIRIAKDENDSVSASSIYALGWKTGYKGIFSDKLLADIPLDYWVSFFNSNFETNRFEVAILSIDGHDIGAGGYGRSRDYYDDNIGEVTSIYFLEEAWGKGYSKHLMDFMLTRLREKGYLRVNLWAVKENARARRFYEKYGFKTTGNEKLINHKGETVTDVEYELNFDKDWYYE